MTTLTRTLASGLGAAAVVCLLFPAAAMSAGKTLGAMGVPQNPKVEQRWDRFNDNDAIGDIIKRIAAAHPDLAKAGSIGTSYQGRTMHLITVTNFKTGDDKTKPAMWIDANIHGNEIQGGEVALYTAWYLTEMYGQVPEVTDLLDRVTFYIVPTINPDGRDYFIHAANTMHSSRSGQSPWDDDGDGLLDEDGDDDLDGDGNITQMRIKDPHGRYKPDPDNPRRMIRVAPDEEGSYTLLDDEGIDNDGDGRVNEDGPGGYDPNRNWPSDWQPGFIQYGAQEYPVCLPETRNVVTFFGDHPNIAAAQTYHNFGGMILRGPGDEKVAFNRRDIPTFDAIGKKGEEMLPGYRYMVLWKDLYTVHGGELDWFYLGRGVISFSNELFTDFNYFRKKESGGSFDDDDDDKRPIDERQEFSKLLLLNQAFVDWKPYDHPQYGKIEIGGWKKNFGRVPPGFLLEEECHRNMAFTLYHAGQLPKISIDDPVVTPAGGGLRRVRVTFANSRLIPTRSAQDVDEKITAYDTASLEGVPVVTSGIVPERFEKAVGNGDRHRDPAKIRVDTLPGMGTTTVEWIVSGPGKATLSYVSEKGRAEKTVEIR